MYNNSKLKNRNLEACEEETMHDVALVKTKDAFKIKRAQNIAPNDRL